MLRGSDCSSDGMTLKPSEADKVGFILMEFRSPSVSADTAIKVAATAVAVTAVRLTAGVGAGVSVWVIMIRTSLVRTEGRDAESV